MRRQQLQGAQQPCALAPLAEGEPGLGNKPPGQGARRDTGPLRPVFQQAVVVGTVGQRLGDAQQARVPGQRQAEWLLGQPGDFIKDHLGDP